MTEKTKYTISIGITFIVLAILANLAILAGAIWVIITVLRLMGVIPN